MKQIVIFILLLVSSIAFAENLVENEVLQGRVKIKLPSTFELMEQGMLEFKYPESNRPTEVYTNPEGSVNIALNYTNNPLHENQIEEFHAVLSQMFHNLYPSATWHRDGVEEINGNKFVVLELVTPAIDTEIHNIISGTSVENRLLLVSFNTTKELSGQWLETGKAIIYSIDVQ